MLYKMSEESRRSAEILIEPQIDEDIGHLDLNQAARLIKAGEVAAEAALDKIKQKIR
jgi:hypothetical protein